MPDVTPEQKQRAERIVVMLDTVAHHTRTASSALMAQGLSTPAGVEAAVAVPTEAAKLIRELAGI